MGLFLFVSAIKNKTPVEISTAIKSYLDVKKVKSIIKPFSDWVAGNQNGGIDMHDIISQPIAMTSIHPLHNKWSGVIYNNCTFEEKDISKFLSIQLKTLISLIEVYDSEVWYHYLYLNGKKVDQFCSSPEIYEDKENWNFFKGNLKKISFYFEIEEQAIQPYLVQLNSENRAHLYSKKAHIDDQYSLGNEWAFIDFWKRLGIRYPSAPPEIVIIHEDIT
jgi:hypothetical protein